MGMRMSFLSFDNVPHDNEGYLTFLIYMTDLPLTYDADIHRYTAAKPTTPWPKPALLA